jgi:hypothetical protein
MSLIGIKNARDQWVANNIPGVEKSKAYAFDSTQHIDDMAQA